MVCFTKFRKAFAAGENAWYFFVTIYKSTDSSGVIGRKAKFLPVVFTN